MKFAIPLGLRGTEAEEAVSSISALASFNLISQLFLTYTQFRMKMEEPEDEEWNPSSSSSSIYYFSESADGKNNGVKLRWVYNIGKKMLVAGLLASSAPIVVPPLFVASAIGIAVCVPYAFFLASHAFAESLLSNLLPRPNPPQLLDEEKELWFLQQDFGMQLENKEDRFLADETKRDDIGMVGFQDMSDEKDVTPDGEHGQGVVDQEDGQGLLDLPDADYVVQHDGSKDDGSDFFCVEEENALLPQKHDDVKIGDEEIEYGVEGQVIGESNGVQEVSGGHGVVITIEGVDEAGDDDIEEFETPFEVTTVLEEFGDKAIEGDIEEEELQRETRGLLEEIRDAGKTDSGGECVDGVRGGTDESDQEIGPVVENLEVAHEDNRGCSTVKGAEGVSRKEEDERVYEELLQPSHAENKDNIYNEVESAEPIRGVLEGKEVDNTNYAQKQRALDSEVVDGRHFQYEADRPTVLQEGKLDNISDSENQESRLHEYNDVLDSSVADAIKNADESGFDLSDTYTTDLLEESSKVMVYGHTAPTEVPFSSVEQELRPSECSSGKDIMCPSQEVVFNEGTEDAGKEEDTRVREEMLPLTNAENEDAIYNEVESAEPLRGILEGKEVDQTNDAQKQLAEHSELLDERHLQYEAIPAEPVGDLMIEKEDHNILVTEDSSVVTSEKIVIGTIVKEELNPVLDGPTVLQDEKLDENISDSVNQESELHEYNKVMDSSDPGATKIADKSGFDLSDEKRVDPDVDAYTNDLHEESSNVMVDWCTDSVEVLVSSAAEELKPNECSSGEDITSPSHKVVFNEESIWKQIDGIRKIIGYEGTKNASCVDELKALYIFTGVEPPTFLKESPYDPTEINEKLHFLMSIVGVKSNED